MNAIDPAATDACCAACGPATNPDETALAIACTLGAGDLRSRVAAIGDLAARSLRRSARNGLTLRLTYDRDALSEVTGLVAGEADCCAFLDIDLRHDAAGVYLTITAPAAAAEAAGELFAHFAPGLARASA